MASHSTKTEPTPEANAKVSAKFDKTCADFRKKHGKEADDCQALQSGRERKKAIEKAFEEPSDTRGQLGQITARPVTKSK